MGVNVALNPRISTLSRPGDEAASLDLDPGFTFAPDGEMVEFEPSSVGRPRSIDGQPEASITGIRPRAESDASALKQVRREHQGYAKPASTVSSSIQFAKSDRPHTAFGIFRHSVGFSSATTTC